MIIENWFLIQIEFSQLYNIIFHNFEKQICQRLKTLMLKNLKYNS